jgi:uncharacterized membrane protein
VSRVQATVTVPGRPAEAEALWMDRSRWASWIDGLAHVERLDPAWPEPGTRLRWSSRPRGRGLVEERVLSRRPESAIELAVEDAKLHGTQRVEFQARGDAVRVTVTLQYSLKERTFPLVDRFFVRRALRDSLRRTLARFAREREAELHPPY